MSRGSDLTHVEAKMKALDVDATKVVQTYQTYHSEVNDTVKDMLVGAGIYDEVHALELEREEVRKKADAKVNDLRAEYAKLVTVREFLLQRDQADHEILTPAPDAKDEAAAPIIEDSALEKVPADEPSLEASSTEAPKEDVAPNKGNGHNDPVVLAPKVARSRPVAPQI